jgi:hypothetical protein
MPPNYQRSVACPDVATTLPEGCTVPIPGSDYEFHECPQYYLRTMSMDLPADHLVDGRHPIALVSADVAELEAGAIRYRDLTPKRASLSQLYQIERDAARAFARKKEGGRG